MANFLTMGSDTGGSGNKKKKEPYIPYIYTSAPAAQPKPIIPAPRVGSSGAAVAAPPEPEFKTPEMTAKDRAMMSQADWLAKYGNINFDQNAIRGIFDAATQAEYAAKKREYSATERQFFDNLGNQQNMTLAARRQSAAQNAVQTGVNRGMQNAALLTDLLTQSQETAPDALALAQGRRLLVDQEQAALALNAKEAEALAEQRKLDYAKVGSEIYATDAQKYVGELGYDAAALEQAMTKYGIDKSAVRSIGGGGGGSSGASATSQLSALTQLYGYAISNGDKNTAAYAAQGLGSWLLGVVPSKK